MRPVTLLFVIFLIVPIAEIYLLIEIGDVIGAPWTIAGVVATALMGAWLVKLQGILTFHRALQHVKQGEAPAVEIVEGLFLLIAGALLITPGFMTDAIGFACLTPPIRQPLAKLLLLRLVRTASVRSRQQGAPSSARNYTYDTDYRDLP